MANLRDIIDYNAPFTILYSGVESDKYFNALCDCGIRDFLMSYHYIQGKKINLQERYGDRRVRMFIDSGAYTYQVNPEYSNYTVEMWEEQIKSYLKWAKANSNLIFAIANLDLDELVGPDVVERWNREYFEPFMLETRIPVCFIWHPVLGEDGWNRMCERYPYVGIPWTKETGEGMDFTFGRRMLKIAQKYNTVVHGMGMTRTSLLTSLPFYTVDSTTWMVGLQYGEVNYWTGLKMSRIKKDKWNEYKTKFEKVGIDFKKLKAEESSELIRANIIAFIEAEKYVRSRLKSRMYWLKVQTLKRRGSLEDVIHLFPPRDWFDSSQEDWADYARTFNIAAEDKTVVIDSLGCLVMFCFWDEENNPYEDMRDTALSKVSISDLHDVYINQVCESDEQRIEELKEFFWGLVWGTNDKLMKRQTAERAKEREDYIIEEDTELVEVSSDEIRAKLSHLLPASTEEAPEIESLDDEIYKQLDIIPVRDEKGRFLKGQKKVLKPKNLYSDKFPKFACDQCHQAATCPEFRAGHVCAFNKMFKRFDSRNMQDIISAMQGMVNYNLERMQRVMVFEQLDTGLPYEQVTHMMEQNMRMLTMLKNMYETANSEVLKMTKVVKSDGSTEETAQISNPSGGGILEKLFMNMGNKNQGEPET